MKKTHKILRIVLLVVIILVVSIVVLINIFGNTALKVGIETAASKTLDVGVSIDKMNFSILGGSVGFEGLVVDNPPGYKFDKLLEVGNAKIVVSIKSLLTDTVDIKEIMFDGVNVVIEQRGVTSNNLKDIINSLPESKPEPEDTAKPAKKLHIDKLQLTNIVVKAKLLPVPGKVDTVTIKLDPIIMTDLGGDNKLDVAALSSKILLAIATGVTKQGAGLLPEGMTNDMKAVLGKVTDLGKATTDEGKKLLEEGRNTGTQVIKGFKGLLTPKK